MPSDRTHGEIPPRRGASARRAFGFRSRKYLVSTLGVQHFHGAQETVQAAGAADLPFHLSGTGKQGLGRGECSRAGEGKHVEPGSGGEREGQENKNTAAKKRSLKRAIQGLPGAVLAQGRAGSTCCWSRQLGACIFCFTLVRCPLVQLHAQHSVLGCS